MRIVVHSKSEIMSDFSTDLYLYLPSAVPATVGQNNISNFTTTLQTPIRLPPEYSYEMCMIKMIYPGQVNNVFAGELSYYSFIQQRLILSRVASGSYSTPADFIVEFNKALGQDSANYLLTFDENSQKFFINLDKENSFLKLSLNLQTLTGLPELITNTGYTISQTSWDVSGGNSLLYVYSDLADYINVGNIKASLIGVLAFGSGSKGENHFQYEPINLVYSPIKREIIQSVKIHIRNKIGDFVEFTSGESLVVVHIRVREPKL